MQVHVCTYDACMHVHVLASQRSPLATQLCSLLDIGLENCAPLRLQRSMCTLLRTCRDPRSRIVGERVDALLHRGTLE